MSKICCKVFLDSSINMLRSFEETCFIYQKDDARLEAKLTGISWKIRVSKSLFTMRANKG